MTSLPVSAYVSPESNTLLWEIEDGNFLPFIHQSCTSTKCRSSFTGFLLMTFFTPSCAKIIIMQRKHTDRLEYHETVACSYSS